MTTPMPVYDDAYYRDYDGQRYERNETWLTLFRHFAKQIVTGLSPKRVLDAGCAIGLLVETLHELGVDSHGIDISESAIAEVSEAVRDRCTVQSLTEPITERYDLITCVEVIEHLPATEALDAVSNLCAATDTVLLSSTPLEHEEPTHVNVQPPEYWSALFAKQGFFRDTEFDASFISPWAVLYRRGSSDVTELVRSYDRAWWRLRDENQRVRNALIDTTEQKQALLSILTDAELDVVMSSAEPVQSLKELTARIREDRSAEARVEDLERRLAEEAQKRLLMRDEVIGAQRRAGEMGGKLAELESELAAHQSLRARCEEAETKYQQVVESTSWRLVWKALAPYRRIRGIIDESPAD